MKLKLISLLIILSSLVVSKSATAQNSIEVFKSDPLLTSLYENVTKFNTTEPVEENTQLIVDTHLAIRSILQQLIERYGESNVREYILKLAEENDRLAGNCCKRNSNGTTNGSCCNFFEWIHVSWDSFWNCDTPLPGDSQSVNNYYNCVQSQICKDC
jgi:hypothetical protein